MTDPIQIPDFIAVTLGFAVFLIGANINARVEILRRFNIPEPVTGGLLAALAVLAVYVTTGREINFILESRDYFLVMFFAAIGLNARLSDLIAGGKPLSVIVSLIMSPISSLNPLLGTAMVVGPVEAWLRKPTVEDCERINDDVQSLKGIYTNPFTRVLLVAVMANLGSALGAWIGATWVIKVLAS